MTSAQLLEESLAAWLALRLSFLLLSVVCAAGGRTEKQSTEADSPSVNQDHPYQLAATQMPEGILVE